MYSRNKLAKLFLKSRGWNKIRGHYISHEGFNCEWEGSYWAGRDFMDFVRRCTYWQHPDYEETVYETHEIMDAVEYEQDVMGDDHAFDKFIEAFNKKNW